MNRREFCFSMGLILTGSVLAKKIPAGNISTGTPKMLCEMTKENRFRAKKIFLRCWLDEFGGETISRQTEILQRKLIRLRQEFNSIVVFSGNGVAPSFFERLKSESHHIGLALFIPVPPNAVFPEQVEAVRCLEISAKKITEAETINKTIKTKTEGFLFSTTGEQRLILFDSSRCLWTDFVCRDDNTKFLPPTDVQLSRLATARFLDQSRTECIFRSKYEETFGVT
jgi:hypothetical protein